MNTVIGTQSGSVSLLNGAEGFRKPKTSFSHPDRTGFKQARNGFTLESMIGVVGKVVVKQKRTIYYGKSS